MSHESLHAGSLIVSLTVLINWSPDNQFGGINFLTGTVELTEFIGSLGSESLISLNVGESWDWGLSCDDDGELEHFDVLGDDGASDGLLLFETISPGFETFMTTFHQHSNSFVLKYTLDHGESLEVLATSDFEYIAIVLLTEESSINFFTHFSIIEDGPKKCVISESLECGVGYHFYSSLMSMRMAVPLRGYETEN